MATYIAIIVPAATTSALVLVIKGLITPDVRVVILVDDVIALWNSVEVMVLLKLSRLEEFCDIYV